MRGRHLTARLPVTRKRRQAPATVATWKVDVLVRVVDELTSGGVTFERYDEPGIETDEKGIFEFDEGGVAWFRDPDGNTFAIEQ